MSFLQWVKTILSNNDDASSARLCLLFTTFFVSILTVFLVYHGLFTETISDFLATIWVAAYSNKAIGTFKGR